MKDNHLKVGGGGENSSFLVRFYRDPSGKSSYKNDRNIKILVSNQAIEL